MQNGKMINKVIKIKYNNIKMVKINYRGNYKN